MSAAPGAQGGASLRSDSGDRGHPGGQAPSRVLARNAILWILVAVMPVAAWAGGRDKAGSLLRDYDSITRNLHKTQLAQSALMGQKALLETRGSDLSKRQDALNAHPRDPNAAAPHPQQTPAENPSRCGNKVGAAGKGTPQHIDGCDSRTKKLDKMSIAVNGGVMPLETRQTQLDLEYNQYNEAVTDWNAQEQQTATALNSLYRSLNDWADRAEGVVTSAPFQAEVRAGHWEKYCPARAMPSGLLHIDDVVRFADGYASCLRYAAAQPEAAATR